MIKLLAKSFYPAISLMANNFYGISVYEGISPALLATMSLSQGVKGSSNDELIDSIAKSNIIGNPGLVRAMKKLDRRHFISDKLNRKESCYQNKPYKISGGQNMTDIFTHAVILEQVSTHIEEILDKSENQDEREITVLDIGTGHGYLAFVISNFLSQEISIRKLNRPHRIIGIDSSLPAIQYCNDLKQQLYPSNTDGVGNLTFHAQPLEDFITQNKTDYDVIIGGFYMPPQFHQGLIEKMKHSSKALNRKTYGIWPSDSANGQSLYSFMSSHSIEKGHEITKAEIMSTMFSMPTVKTAVSKYFVQDSEKEANEETESVNEDEVRQKLKLLKIQKKKKQKEEAKQNLKVAIQKYNKGLNKKLTLAEMKEIPEISLLLEAVSKK